MTYRGPTQICDRLKQIGTHAKTTSLAGLVISSFMLSSAVQAQVIDADERGWYNSNGSHNPANNNTYTGRINTTEYRTYFRFPIPSGLTCISSATLEVELEGYWGNGSTHTANFFDVTQANVPSLDLTDGGGSGLAIYNDLGTGTGYGNVGGLNNADTGSLVTVNLPSSSFVNIIAASGTDFAIGNRTTLAGGGNVRGLRYSYGGENRTHRLTIVQCPVAPDISVTKTSTVSTLGSATPFNTPGNDVAYTVAVRNSGIGSPDNNTVFIVDAMPADIIFYNGDFDGAGPGSAPVVANTTGSGLTFNSASDLAFSNTVTAPTSFAACSYTPAPGYDLNITFICFNPKGVMASGSPAPEISFKFRGKVK